MTGVDDFMKFIGKGAVIKFGNISEELKQAEMEKLKEYFKEMIFGTTNCYTKRFEDDPVGNEIWVYNSTLKFLRL